MSNEEAIRSFFVNQLRAPGRRMQQVSVPSTDKFAKYDRMDRFFNHEQALGRRAKRVLTKYNRSAPHNYKQIREIHIETLKHYEDMEWWERDSSFDMDGYVDRLT